ncbi:MAG: hypothetical protein Q9217_005302 [Psora testacea]
MTALQKHKAQIWNLLNEQYDALGDELERQTIARDHDLESERQTHHRNVETLRTTEIELDEVKAENQRLRIQLEATQETSKQRISDLLDELKTIQAQLEQCKKDFQKVMRARGMLETRCRHYRDIQKEWRAYYRDWILRHPKKTSDDAIGDSSREAGAAVRVDRSSASAPAPPSCLELPSSLSDVSRSASPCQKQPSDPVPGAKSTHGGGDALAATQAAFDRSNGTGLTDLTETTDDSEGITSTARRVSSHGETIAKDVFRDLSDGLDTDIDSQIVVSERSLKRKRPHCGSGVDIQIHEDNHAAPGSCSVKDEQRSSSPLSAVSSTLPHAAVSDSLDLDQVGSSISTPRKRQRLEQVRRRSSMMAQVGQPQVTDLHLDEAVEENGKELLGSAKVKDEGNASLLHDNRELLFKEPLQVQGQRQKARKEAQVAQQNAHNERVHQRLISKGAKFIPPPASVEVENRMPVTVRGLRARPRQAPQASSVALQPTDPNALPRTSGILANDKQECAPNHGDRRAVHVLALAEDGDNSIYSKPGKRMTGKNKKVTQAPDAHRRLVTLLNDPPPPSASVSASFRELRSSTSSSTTRRGVPTVAPMTPQSLPPKNRLKALVQTASKSAQPLTTKHRHTPSMHEEPDIQPEDEPLRARPLHRLRLEDFKLNPNHSHYAYHETLRKHDEKKARSGCRDPFCQRCKDLKKFVEMSGYTAPKKAGLFDSSPPEGAEDAANERLLRNYLDNDAYRLPRMSEQEKNDLLLKAKTKQFQDQFGKHRQGMSRGFEAPGFWDTDFPSTQENERLREEARLMESLKVEERWEEARRRGMWLFADEV